jgi:hypothetical protein
MRNALFALIIGLFIGCAAKPQDTPTADQILDKYIQALGGKDAIEKVTSRVMKGSMENPDEGSSSPAEFYMKPGAFYSKIDVAGYGVVEQGIKGDTGWSQDPDSGLKNMSRNDIAAALRDHDVHRELRLKELYPTMTVSRANENGHEYYLIEATPAKGAPEKLLFDPASGLLVKQTVERVTQEEGIVPTDIFYEDYKDFDGVKVPTTVRQVTPDYTSIMKIKEVQNNAPIDDSKFAKPAKKS